MLKSTLTPELKKLKALFLEHEHIVKQHKQLMISCKSLVSKRKSDSQSLKKNVPLNKVFSGGMKILK